MQLVAKAAETVPTFAPVETLPPPADLKWGAWAIMRMAIATAWASFYALVATRNFSTDSVGEHSGYFVGSWVGALLLPFGLAYFAAGRQKLRNWNKFSHWFFWAAIIMGFMSLSGNMMAHPQLSQDQLATEMLKEAKEHPDEIMPGNDEKALGVNFLRRMIVLNRTVAEERNKCGMPPHVYSAESFSSAETMQATIDKFNECVDFDSILQAKQDKAISELQQQVNGTAWANGKKKAFLDGFEKGMESSRQHSGPALDTERAWRKSVGALYKFSIEHASDFKVRGDKVIIANHELLEKFNALQKQSLADRETFDKAKAEFDNRRKELQNRMNVTPQDIGEK